MLRAQDSRLRVARATYPTTPEPRPVTPVGLIQRRLLRPPCAPRLAIGGYVVQALAHFFEASQIVMLIEQLFEILQFSPFHEPYLDLI